MKKMGGISQIMSMIPGMGRQLKGVELNDDMFKGMIAIINSMTKEERSNPALMNPSRKKRIAAGAGVDISEVNRLVKQVENQKKMMKQLSGAMGGKGKRGFKLPFGF
jgi:signal recognition particle subunit SRP54